MAPTPASPACSSSDACAVRFFARTEAPVSPLITIMYVNVCEAAPSGGLTEGGREEEGERGEIL